MMPDSQKHAAALLRDTIRQIEEGKVYALLTAHDHAETIGYTIDENGTARPVLKHTQTVILLTLWPIVETP